jgi:hypothetical protein
MNNPIQPLVKDADGTIRFRVNAIVRHLYDNGTIKLNDLAKRLFTDDDRAQFAQLLGYSVSRFGELSYVPPALLDFVDGCAGKSDLGLGEIFGTATGDSHSAASKRTAGETEHEVELLVKGPHGRSPITVFDIGSNVFIGSIRRAGGEGGQWGPVIDLVACITGVAIYGQGRVQYQVAWWDNTAHHSQWLEEFEVRATPNTPTVQIGFRNRNVSELRTEDFNRGICEGVQYADAQSKGGNPYVPHEGVMFAVKGDGRLYPPEKEEING